MEEVAGNMVAAVTLVVAAVTTALVGGAVTMAMVVLAMAPVVAAIATTALILFREEDTVMLLVEAMQVTAVGVATRVMALVVLEATVILSRGDQVARLGQVLMEFGTTLGTVETSKGGVQGGVVPW
jgi:hypothetical protein